MRTKKIKTVIGILCVSALTGCSGLLGLPGSGDAPQIYRLTPAAEFEAVQAGSQSLRVLVDEPDASRAIDTDRIAIRPSEVEINYYSGAKWSDRAPRLIQSLLIQSLENTGAVQLAGRGSSGMNAQYLINSQLMDFQVEQNGDGAVAHIRIKLNLIEQRRSRILASEIFEAEVDAVDTKSKTVVLAFNEAMNTVLSGASTWALNKMNGRRR